MDFNMHRFYRHTVSSIIIATVLISLGCSTSEKTRDDEPDYTEEEVIRDEDLSSLQIMLAESRSKLSDVHTSLNHDMPAVFQKKDSSDAALRSDPSDGYRVQIISTKDVELADSVANKFRSWADSTIEGYSAETYVSFNQPFYKVHIGDFQKRDQANSFSKLIKRRYPDAWVVHDRIKPSNVPADTASFSMRKIEDLSSEN